MKNSLNYLKKRKYLFSLSLIELTELIQGEIPFPQGVCQKNQQQLFKIAAA